MNKISVIFICFISACNNQMEIKLSELKFPFPDKKGILTNSIDSTILVSEYNSRKDTVGLITYDTTGRILYDGSNQWDTYRYEYDSLGFVKSLWYRDWDVYLRFKASYNYFPDSLLLVQHWTGDYPYTTRFKFNSNGYLIEEATDDPDNLMDVVRKATTTFEYNNYHELVKRDEKIFHDNKLDKESIMSVFYTGSKVDSIVTFVNSDRLGIRKIVDHYDTRGLRKLTIKQGPDTVLQMITYFHKSRAER